jgi:hypothetical protein
MKLRISSERRIGRSLEARGVYVFVEKKLTKEQGGFESVRKRRSGEAGGGYEGT